VALEVRRHLLIPQPGHRERQDHGGGRNDQGSELTPAALGHSHALMADRSFGRVSGQHRRGYRVHLSFNQSPLGPLCHALGAIVGSAAGRWHQTGHNILPGRHRSARGAGNKRHGLANLETVRRCYRHLIFLAPFVLESRAGYMGSGRVGGW
jgi:hypothetical protein